MIERRQEKSIIRNPFTWLILLLLIVAGVLFYVNSANKPEKSYIYEITKECRETGKLNIPKDLPFEDETPERYYLKGLMAYNDGKMRLADRHFKEAEKVLDTCTDPGLAACLYCYLNYCYVELNGGGNRYYVEKAVAAAIDYHPVANDHGLIWETCNSIAYSVESDEVTINLLEQLMASVEGLSLEARVRYNNCIAMLDFFDGNYEKSIRRFYDVQAMLEGVELNPELTRQLLFTNSYIAGFYFEFEDYETAIELYEKNIAIPVEDKELNARMKYSDIINMSSAYFEIGNTRAAINTVKKLEEILPYINEEIRADVEASMYDNMARGAILLEEYEKAGEYLDKADELISRMDKSAFYGSDYFIKLTRCKLMLATGDTENAKIILEEMCDSGEAAYAGLEDEVYTLLSDIYKNEGDAENFMISYTALMDLKSDFHNTVQKGYLIFSKYYSEKESLARQNQELTDQYNTSRVIIVLVIVILCMVVIGLLEIRKMGLRDQLTGFWNRKVLNKLLKKYTAGKLPVNTCVVMMDIDHFKKYNDTYGHVKGDEVLRGVARAVKESVRRRDLLIRYGGEEFMAFLRNVNISDGATICQRILDNVEKANIPHNASDTADHITVSIGLCVNSNSIPDMEEMIRLADEALYESKETGRNKKTIVQV